MISITINIPIWAWYIVGILGTTQLLLLISKGVKLYYLSKMFPTKKK